MLFSATILSNAGGSEVHHIEASNLKDAQKIFTDRLDRGCFGSPNDLAHVEVYFDDPHIIDYLVDSIRTQICILGPEAACTCVRAAMEWLSDNAPDTSLIRWYNYFLGNSPVKAFKMAHFRYVNRKPI